MCEKISQENESRKCFSFFGKIVGMCEYVVTTSDKKNYIISD
jgi:hypothetical protein